MDTFKIGFLGAGGIAKAHVYALKALKFYYDEVPRIKLASVASSRKESSEKFALKYGFSKSESVNDFFKNPEINTVFICGPNKVHFEHLKLSLQMPNVTQIYLEKPVCASLEEEELMNKMVPQIGDSIKIQIGFQFLQSSSVREALKFWKSGKLGRPIHFDIKYFHGDYLKMEYRKKRVSRLNPAPDGGAMGDLGSHGISLLMAFFNEEIQIKYALQGGSFDDVPVDCDLFSSLSLYDPLTKAVGNLSASRVSSGTGDFIYLEIYAQNGALRYSSQQADFFEYFLEETNQWVKKMVGSNYKPLSSFPSGHVPPGWLRSMVHAHYNFFIGNDSDAFKPDLSHGLAVQRIVRETAGAMSEFRKTTQNG